MNIKYIIILVACLTMLFSLGCTRDSTSRWAGVYQIPDTKETGVVSANFHMHGDQLNVTCRFRNTTFNFDGVGQLKGEIKKQKLILSGLLEDTDQGETIIEVHGTIREDTLEGFFVQTSTNGEGTISGGIVLVRINQATYRGHVQQPPEDEFENIPPRYKVTDQNQIDLGVATPGLIGPGRADVYGPGIHADATGRPFSWRTEDSSALTFGRVKENACGLGVGRDQFGRRVRAKPLW
jgi:hypothetical protein